MIYLSHSFNNYFDANAVPHVFEIGTVWTIYRDFQKSVDKIVN